MSKETRKKVRDMYYCMARCEESQGPVSEVNACMQKCGAEVGRRKEIIGKEMDKFRAFQSNEMEKCANQAYKGSFSID